MSGGNLNRERMKKHQALYKELMNNFPEYPKNKYKGRGIVMCGGGPKYFTCAWVAIRMLRHVKCDLPVELWYLGDKEMDDTMKALIEPYGVKCVDAYEVRKLHPSRILNGWELNPYSIIHSQFKEVLFLDADNIAIVNPEYLFESNGFRETGAIFWPDYGRLKKTRTIWEICQVPYKDEREFESGQIVIDKERCWNELALTMHINEHSDFYYNHIHGDKETYHMAWKMLNTPYTMPKRNIDGSVPATMCQHDLWGNRIFQHRNMAKWKIDKENRNLKGFRLEQECLDYLDELKGRWCGKVNAPVLQAQTPKLSVSLEKLAEQMSNKRYLYIREGYDRRAVKFLKGGFIGEGGQRLEQEWWLEEKEKVALLHIGADKQNITCTLKLHGDVWKGRWLKHEKMPITLIPSNQ